ncbi:hypothetical protein CN912_11970 [Bacillus cereus]|uniref:ABC-three component system protein n=1 Tax=Bacillus cereus group TaxID=86661 RepID=UPI000BF137E6|nr:MULTISPECIES: ABC-three component system protein [Bacillus cereus group]PEL43857.1 hypothetical protein CN607_05375 [Bacillus wiedmannii]PGL11847.1 hypothetical protein CN912_11970 [Bacillus cereus]
MNIFRKYEHLSVKVNYKSSEGSGCLFQAHTQDYTYVLTAKHCIMKKGEKPENVEMDEIKITQFPGMASARELKIKDFLAHDEYDIAIIVIEPVSELPATMITELTNGQKNVSSSCLNIYGFPKVLKSEAIEGQKLECKLVHIYPNRVIEIKALTNLETYDVDAQGNIRGLSGSGLYIEQEDALLLTGILTELKDKDGAYKSLLAIDVVIFNELLEKKGLPKLLPQELLSFKQYIETAFHRNENSLVRALLRREAQTTLDFTPKGVVEALREKICLPYNHQFDSLLLKSELWEGWVELLTYLSIETEQLPNAEKFELLRGVDTNKHKIKMYYSNSEYLNECIAHLVEIYDDLEVNDCIIINNKKNPLTKSIGNKEFKDFLATKIDAGKLFEQGIYIDDPNYDKGVRCLHIDKFPEKFLILRNESNPSEVKKQIKISIQELFADAH